MPHQPHEEIVTNLSDNPQLTDIVGQRLADPARRCLLRAGFGAAALSFVGSGTAGLMAGCGGSDGPEAVLRPASLSFGAVAKSRADVVTLPAGYNATVLMRLGDPIAAGVDAYRNDGTDAASTYDRRVGDHHDGMHWFGLGAAGGYDAESTTRGLIVMNHEAITPSYLHVAGATIVGSGNDAVRTVAEEVQREFYLHGVSITEVNRAANGAWSYNQLSSLNRRIHTLTDCQLRGPAAGQPAMVTRYSTNGTRTRGTVNNCANGTTPWGTYLTCEENWAGYFRRLAAIDNPTRSVREIASLSRYGVTGTGRELWATVKPDTGDDLYGRWNAMRLGTSADRADDYRNAPNTYGWVVEIDPFSPNSPPRKRTALGRFGHEGAWAAKAVAGKPLVWYMGDDARSEYIYKYVSAAHWDPADATRGLAAGDKYLDNGKLYVARFAADGTGTWLELSFGVNGITAQNAAYAFADPADVLINARLAADAAGATKMDRPEWGAVDPVTGAVYMTLTNNNATLRTLANADAANPRHYNDPRTTGTAQRGNPNGHIVRWLEASSEALTFRWDIFLFGARAGADAANVNLSGLTADNDFSSPDGLWFSRHNGICWIQTDDGAYTDVTNCMLLAALPGTVGDGGARTITNTDASGATRQVATQVGAPPGAKLRRFLVGPVECEITGLAETPDGRALFVNIQHPGEEMPAASIGNPAAYTSHWPDGGLARPRSATIVITRSDGGVIGA